MTITIVCMPSAVLTLTFLGATSTVTGSRFLLDTGEVRVLVDCGMYQGLQASSATPIGNRSRCCLRQSTRSSSLMLTWITPDAPRSPRGDGFDGTDPGHAPTLQRWLPSSWPTPGTSRKRKHGTRNERRLLEASTCTSPVHPSRCSQGVGVFSACCI